jgi:transmembrane sensor
MSPDPIEVRASQWLAARDAGSPTPAQAEEFNRWLDADIRHRVAYLRLEAQWRRAEKLRDLKPLDGPVDPDLLAPRTPRRWPLALAASVLLVLAGGWLYQSLWSWDRFETPVGGLSRIVLEDGSVVDLNTDSDVRVRLREGHRQVRLVRGEGRFQVAHDARRPFTVEAAGTAVRAVGTQFTVRLHGSEQVDVLVAEGKVAVDSAHGQATPPLSAGDAAVLRPDRVSVSRLEPQLVARRMAWTTGRLEFRGETLAEAVAEFNRYNHRQIRLASADLAGLRVGGNFAATDPESFAGALASAFKLRVQSDPQSIVLRAL